MSVLSQFIQYYPKKLVQRFTLTMGTYRTGGINYWTLGSAQIIDSVSSTDNSAYIFSPDGPAGRFCFVNLGRTVNPNKTFLTHSFSGHSSTSNERIEVRLYNWNQGVNPGYHSINDTEAYQIQLIHRDNWPKSSYGTEFAPEITVEVVEYL